MISLSHNDWAAALELFTAVHEDPLVLEHPQTLDGGLSSLSAALEKVEAAAGVLSVVHFMLEHCIKVRGLYYIHHVKDP